MAHLLRKEAPNIRLHTQDAIDENPEFFSDILSLKNYLSEINILSSKIFVIAGPSYSINLLEMEMEEFIEEISAPEENYKEIEREGSDNLFFILLSRMLYNGRASRSQKNIAKEAKNFVLDQFEQRGIQPQGALTSILNQKNKLNYPPHVVAAIPNETESDLIARYDESLSTLKAIRAVMPGRKLTPEVSHAIQVDHNKKITSINTSNLNGSTEILFKASEEGLLPVPLVTVENGHRTNK